jgi:hypothetical protein
MISIARRALENIGCKFIFTGFRYFDEDFPDCPAIAGKLLAYENIGSILTQYKDEIRLDVLPILNALNFGTDQKFFETRPITIPERGNTSHRLPEIHPLPLEHLDFLKEYILPVLGEDCKQAAVDFAEKYQQEVLKNNPIVLLECNWFQESASLLGFSDDRWRP